MARINGWLPTSQKLYPAPLFLNEFTSPFEPYEIEDSDYPIARSGHRCFTDNDYVYVIGGYTSEIRGGAIFKELWAMSLATFEWRRYETNGNFPEHLASFAIIQVYPFAKTFILFGGSGTMFGDTSSNDFYLVQVNNEDCTVECQKINVEGTIPEPVYGHAMCAGGIPGKYYIIGGTEGALFNFEVYSLTLIKNPEAIAGQEKLSWKCELINGNRGYAGRYRLEATYDERLNCLFMFGGGNHGEVFGFEQIIKVDLQTRESSEVTTFPDEIHGYPANRRCHTLVRRGRIVIISGGVDHPTQPDESPVHSDVWLFNLDDYTWKLYDHKLPRPVFFHDTVITEDGWMLTFGGIHGLQVNAPRNNTLYGAWFGVPRLQRFALESLRRTYPSRFSGLYCGNLRPSQVFEVFSVFCKGGTIEGKERQIIEKGQVKFHEKGDRSRYFLNFDGLRFAIKHQRDPEPIRLGNRRRRRPQVEDEDAERPAVRIRHVHQRLQDLINRLFAAEGIENRDNGEYNDVVEDETESEDEFDDADIVMPERDNVRRQE